MALFDETVVLNRYNARYFRCDYCGFIQPQEPHWLDEAYSDAITASDVGLVGRNSALASVTQLLLLSFFDTQSKYLDYGGGYGLFVRQMRDMGFDFYRFDKYCDNIFAQGFDTPLSELGLPSPTGPYELTTAFELFEHLVDPVTEMEQIAAFSKNVFFSTTLLPVVPPRLDSWWYYGLEHGQHVALYTEKSLSILAERNRMYFSSNGNSLHLFSRKPVSPAAFSLVTRYSLGIIASVPLLLLRRKRSLTLPDYERVTGQRLV
jgi:hypothetical protein